LSLVYGPDQNHVRRNAVSSLKAGRPVPYEFRLVTRGGEIRWVIETLISIPYEGEKGALGCVVDISEHKLFEKALESSEQRYRQLVDLSQDGILRLDANGRVASANQAACRIFGYNDNEMVGIPISQTMLEEDRLHAQERWKQLTSDKFARYERQAVRKDGTVFSLDVSISPLTEGNFLEVVRDVSLRKQMEMQLQESEKKYRLMVESQSDLISELTPDGKLKFLNPSYIQLLGKPEADLLGMYVGDLIHPDDREKGSSEVRSAYSPPYSAYSESRMITRMGWRWIAWRINGIQGTDGQVTSLACLGRDITENKQAKEELEQANRRLRELDRLKDNFLSTVSHELRTPLTSIKSFAEILLSYKEDEATQKEFLGIINNEADRLTRLINDFLDISKIQAGRMQWKNQPVEVDKVIQQAITSTGPLIARSKLELSTEIAPDLPAVWCDKDRLIQVMTNLLGNAVKFTPEGGLIRIQAQYDTQNNREGKRLVTVSVRDSGIGIAPENHQKIFETFGQVGDVLKDRPKGTGLGLSISKKIIETFGGKIWVESAPGQGSTFIFNLPVAENQSQIPEGSPPGK
jgi:PAS domain S-box-containing protein